MVTTTARSGFCTLGPHEPLTLINAKAVTDSQSPGCAGRELPLLHGYGPILGGQAMGAMRRRRRLAGALRAIQLTEADAHNARRYLARGRSSLAAV